jgi:general secretion pathway protein D
LLATTLGQLIRGAQPAPAAGAAATAAARNSGGVVVDKATNMLIFHASQDEYSQIIALLQMLDKPSKAALIEVTVAEMSSDDADKLGVEWSFTNGRSNGGSIVGGTLGGLNLGTAGLNYQILDAAGSVKLALNALASKNRATVLSSPRLLARNGESASIQVGQEVPIITSQSSTPTTGTSATVLQTVQYRSTGVILKIKPVIHSGDQVDLDISQEVSAAATTTTGVSVSPTFSSRKVDTKLTLRNGTTVMLGGLISEDSSGGDAGVPLLKDIPMLGALFRSQTAAGSRKQLVVLITPYIINNDNDAQALTGAFRNLLGPWAGGTGPLLSVQPNAPPAATPAAGAAPTPAPGR